MLRKTWMAAWLWAALVGSTAIADGVTVELREEVAVSRPLVLVRDIAALRGGSASDRNAIGNLDLVLLNDATPETAISRRLIQVRLLVARMDADAATFTGAEEVRVFLPVIVQATATANPPPPTANLVTDSLIEERLEQFCSRSLGQEIEDVDVHLTQPIAAQALRGLEGDIEFQIVPSQNIVPGSNTASIQFWQNGELIKTTTTRFDVVVNQSVLVLNRFIPLGTAITSDMVTEQRRPVSVTGLLSHSQDVVGTEAMRDLTAGTVLSSNMVRIARNSRPQPVIKTRDLVMVTYSRSGLSLTMPDAVAMQDGQVGDSIRVMNPNSRIIFAAFVVGPGRVEIQSGNLTGGSR